MLITLFQSQYGKKYLKLMEEVVRILCITLSNIQIPFYNQVDNLDFIKYVNRMLIFLLFHHEEMDKLMENPKGDKTVKNSMADLDKCIKFVFKLCFLGN